MRGLLLIICAISAAQGNPVSSSNEQGVNYKKQAQTLLKNIETIQKDMKEVVEQGKVIQEELHESRNKIFTVINENPLVLEMKETLLKSENQEKVGECQQQLDNKLYWLGVNLRQHLTDDVESNLKALELTKLIMDSELEEIKRDLKNNLENNQDPCTKGDTSCDTIGAYVDKIEEGLQIVDLIKTQVPNMINNVLDYLATAVVPKQIPEIQESVDKCMK
ncbi:hypothetical protein TSAR_000577 [Trichomalopsis sarcophagae]|uniref:Protein TsetseEP domain-containing protein n=1 Tax=Trichomalopsis sarcophagae TaxID=543379 RepID=A0A232EK56_9HYME|nr:hypothetical protein TSAR_000577 [Trichomalopsis sarcophagae]